MKSSTFRQTDVNTLRAKIQADEARRSFDLLVQAGIDARSLAAGPGGNASNQDFRYQRTSPKGWPFSLSPNKEYLLFCVRPLGTRTLGVSSDSLSRLFSEVRERAGAELQVVVRSLRDAQSVVEHILRRWPGEQSAAAPPLATDLPAAGEVTDERVEQELTQRSDIGAREKRALIQARHGLGAFRVNVEQLEGACRITGLMDRRHLRASHIKPWRLSTDAEKLDGHNGFLLSPHVEHLFSRGYISFADDGALLVSRQLNSTVLKHWHIALPIKAWPLRKQQKHYVAWHREQVFEKAATGGQRRK